MSARDISLSFCYIQAMIIMIPAELALWISYRQRCLLCSNSKWTDLSLHMQRRLRVFSFIYCMCLYSPKLSFISLAHLVSAIFDLITQMIFDSILILIQIDSIPIHLDLHSLTCICECNVCFFMLFLRPDNNTFVFLLLYMIQLYHSKLQYAYLYTFTISIHNFYIFLFSNSYINWCSSSFCFGIKFGTENHEIWPVFVHQYCWNFCNMYLYVIHTYYILGKNLISGSWTLNWDTFIIHWAFGKTCH